MQKQTNVRLSQVALDHLTTLRAHYGLSQTALFEFLLREHARQVAKRASAAPRGSLTQAVSPGVDEDEIDEADASRFRGFRASVTRAELER